jgi:hypothetical protein
VTKLMVNPAWFTQMLALTEALPFAVDGDS